MQVGDTVWVFSQNHRVYHRDSNGKCFGGPIYREHFVQRTIVGETTKSWLLVDGTKISKKTLEGIYTDQQKEDSTWDHDTRFEIVDKIRYGDSVSVQQLREIAKIIGLED